MLLAPMIGQLEHCHTQSPLPAEFADDPAFVHCSSVAGSAAAVIETTLMRLGPRFSSNGHFELGYTLNLPLLKLLVKHDGQWVPDKAAIDRMIKVVEQSERRLILYLFSNHFSVFAPIESELMTDHANLAQSPQGSLSIGKHYGMNVYPWSISRTDNTLTAMRLSVIDAVVKTLCEHPLAVRKRLAAITLLGETHHLFPAFESGMGFTGNYVVSDYSQESVLGFRTFLKKKFTDTQSLNSFLGSSVFSDFDDIYPPSKDIRTEKLSHYWEHIDSYAQGRLPVQGWLAPHPRLTGIVTIYLNGKLLGKARSGLGRQDVIEQMPSLGTADVGWRFDLDFHSLMPGIYKVAAMAEVRDGLPVILGDRDIVIMDRHQSVSPRIPPGNLPKHEDSSEVVASMDQPRHQSDYYYNPLAALWLEFRNEQVVSYLKFIERPLKQSCLADVPRYVHQLFPYPNPSWDENKYAVDGSLRHLVGLNLGVSLYGEATYGTSFIGWKQRYRKGEYGITEFHPLRGMDPIELGEVLNLHRENGAQFLSFFLEGRGHATRPFSATEPTVPFFGEATKQNGADKLYGSLQKVMSPQ